MGQLMLIRGVGSVAARYGLEESVFLDTIMFWWRTNRADNRNFRDGRWWTYNSMKAYEDMFPWWTGAQIRRIIAKCKEKGALLTGDYNEDRRDRTMWYSPSEELLALYGEEIDKCICQNQQMHLPKPADACAENDAPLPCSYSSDILSPYSPPVGDAPAEKPGCDALFDRFWAAYPNKRDKEKARRAWRRLKPDLELCRVMSAALELDKRSAEWQKEGGKYIPYPSTWLNGKRWEDEHAAPQPLLPQQPLRGEGVRYLNE